MLVVNSYCNSNNIPVKMMARIFIRRKLDDFDTVGFFVSDSEVIFSSFDETKAVSICRVNCVWEVKGYIAIHNPWSTRLQSGYSVRIKNIKGTTNFMLLDFSIPGFK